MTSMKTNKSIWLILLIILSFEKFVQHMFVTYAFYVDLDEIRGKVVIDHNLLMISGFIVGILFLVNIPFLYQGKRFSVILLFFLALFDFIGEFVAQGTLAIEIMVSFIVATIILLIIIFKRKELLGNKEPSAASAIQEDQV